MKQNHLPPSLRNPGAVGPRIPAAAAPQGPRGLDSRCLTVTESGRTRPPPRLPGPVRSAPRCPAHNERLRARAVRAAPTPATKACALRGRDGAAEKKKERKLKNKKRRRGPRGGAGRGASALPCPARRALGAARAAAAAALARRKRRRPRRTLPSRLGWERRPRPGPAPLPRARIREDATAREAQPGPAPPDSARLGAGVGYLQVAAFVLEVLEPLVVQLLAVGHGGTARGARGLLRLLPPRPPGPPAPRRCCLPLGARALRLRPRPAAATAAALGRFLPSGRARARAAQAAQRAGSEGPERGRGGETALQGGGREGGASIWDRQSRLRPPALTGCVSRRPRANGKGGDGGRERVAGALAGGGAARPGASPGPACSLRLETAALGPRGRRAPRSAVCCSGACPAAS